MTRRVRVWSAGCSTGEEPYSLAMALLSALPPEDGWDVQILATDLSTRVLEVARQGVYSTEKAAAIPRPYLQTFMLRGVGSQDGNVKVSPALQAAVTFRRLNLNDDDYAVRARSTPSCAATSSSTSTRRRATGSSASCSSHLRPRGHFFVGHSESLGGTPGLETVIPTVYRKRGPAKVRVGARASDATATFGGDSRAGAPRRHVIVVDDSAVAREVMSAVLRASSR